MDNGTYHAPEIFVRGPIGTGFLLDLVRHCAAAVECHPRTFMNVMTSDIKGYFGTSRTDHKAAAVCDSFS